MSKRFLGLICLIYSAIFIYVAYFNKLKNFLAPGMQIYIKISIIPLIIIGVVMLFNSKINYKFKISDLVLVLPLILLILAGDGRLTASFAKNRTTTFKNNKKINRIVKKDANKKENNKKEEFPLHSELSIDYDINDDVYFETSEAITYAQNPDKFVGKTIRVRGFALKNNNVPNGYFGIGKYGVSCCAADAEFIGFLVKNDKNYNISKNSWYEIEGTLKKGKDIVGQDVLVIEIVNIKELKTKEELYVYPCYSYGDGSCSQLDKYNLDN